MEKKEETSPAPAEPPKKKVPIDMKRARIDLQTANRIYIECIERNFLPRFFNNEKVRIEEVCVDELRKMQELDQMVYGKFQWPVPEPKKADPKPN